MEVAPMIGGRPAGKDDNSIKRAGRTLRILEAAALAVIGGLLYLLWG
jgi:hypothetical protein